MGYNTAKINMKRFFIMVILILGFMAFAEAQTNKLYTVTVTVTVTYKYYEENGTYVSSQNGGTETQTIQVCASSPQDAREKAIAQCEGMCRGQQDMGKATMGGKTCNKYKERSVYDASVPKIVTQEC